MTGKYTVDHPFPAGSARAAVYNSQLPQLTQLVTTLTAVGQTHDLSAAQTALAWAIAKGAFPIIGMTKVAQVDQAAQAAAVQLSKAEVTKLDIAASKTTAETAGFWEPKY